MYCEDYLDKEKEKELDALRKKLIENEKALEWANKYYTLSEALKQHGLK